MLQFLNVPTVCTARMLCGFGIYRDKNTYRERIDDFLLYSSKSNGYKSLKDFSLVYAIITNSQNNNGLGEALQEIGFKSQDSFEKTKDEDQRHRETGALILFTIHAVDLDQYRNKLTKKEPKENNRRFGQRPRRQTNVPFDENIRVDNSGQASSLWATRRNYRRMIPVSLTGSNIPNFIIKVGIVREANLTRSQYNYICDSTYTINSLMERIRDFQRQNESTYGPGRYRIRRRYP